ncbi:MAG: DNA gyrase subunit B [Leptospiraceae bacterium]|nr:DNA gyrase subunit B [Leptospiraceae bacterium]MCP5499231.1 DNA gyrase subunit B [Leptospiraceae bacterium]
MTKKTAEASSRNFKKLSNVEHVRMRTGMWLGQNSMSTFEQHYFLRSSDKKYSIEHKEINEIPAKLKCLDEACMNAVDEYRKNLKDPKVPPKDKMSRLSVSLSNNCKRITVADNGRGIPASNAEGVYLHLMYGENFDDQVKQDHVAGQNGVGISLVRMVSAYFRVETINGKQLYKKVFTLHEDVKKQIRSYGYKGDVLEKIFLYFDEHGTFKSCNLMKEEEIEKLNPLLKKHNHIEIIQDADPKKHGTEVEFELDSKFFNKLDMSFDSALLEQYLQDIAMTNPGLEVTFSHKKKTEKFKFKKGMDEIFANSDLSYYKMEYQNPEAPSQIHLETYVVMGQNKTLTWVNTNFAVLGGSAIEYLENRLCDEVRKKNQIVQLEKKLKTACTRNDVRNCFHMYVNLRILNPRFKSQDKSYLINDLNEEIRKAVDKNLDKLLKKTNLLDEVKGQMERRTRMKEMEEAQKGVRKASKMNIAKLMPPTGKPNEPGRTLFIAEGDSAIAGLRPARNPKIHGLFPLRGKPMNCKGMSLAKALANEELKNIVAIIGLPINGHVSSIDELNYERISIITDADFDGYAIRSLMLSFFFEYWPELFELGVIHVSSAPLYEVDIKWKNGKKETFFCIDDKDYDILMKRVEKEKGEMARKKRNKGLGETGKEAMRFAVDKCMTKILLNDKKAAQEIQLLWFHKGYAEQRREAISEYAMSVIED